VSARRHPVGNQEEPVEAAPDHERPGRAVPQAAEHHRDHQVRERARLRTAIATERDVQVVAKPCRQADVPVTPEFLRGPDEIRESEVLEELDAHQLGRAAGDVRIPGEIAIDLKSERVHADEHVDTGRRGLGIEHRVGEPGDIVRDEHLLKVPPRDQPCAVPQLLGGDPAR
jgi:hypothetical protein